MAVNHLVLKWVVVVALVQQWVYPPSVNLQLAMLQYVARNRYWKGRGYFLAVSRKEQLAHYVVCEVDPQHTVKQVSLEVDYDVVSVFYQVSIVVKIQYHLGMSDNLVFLPL